MQNNEKEKSVELGFVTFDAMCLPFFPTKIVGVEKTRNILLANVQFGKYLLVTLNCATVSKRVYSKVLNLLLKYIFCCNVPMSSSALDGWMWWEIDLILRRLFVFFFFFSMCSFSRGRWFRILYVSKVMINSKLLHIG